MALDSLKVDLTIVLGTTRLPLHQVLRMGRGAIVALDPSADDVVDILANGLAVARGRVVVEGRAIRVEVTDLVRRPAVTRERGTIIGGRLAPAGDRPSPSAETASGPSAPAQPLEPAEAAETGL